MGTIDDYLAGLEPEDRAVIERVYAVAREVVPEAEQGKSYGMPALIYRGKALISVMRTKKHFGLYPFSGQVVAAVADALAGFETDTGTIRFQPEHPLSDEQLVRIVHTRKEQIDG